MEVQQKNEMGKGQQDQIRIISQERDNYRARITEIENRLKEKEDMLDKIRKEYNELMEKYLKTPKKVTTTSTTIKTVVDQDPTEYEMPGRNSNLAIENKASGGHNREVQAEGDREPWKEDLAWIAEL